MKKICELCGDEFEAKQKTQKYCSKTHYRQCPACKKYFKLGKNKKKKACSIKCASKYRLENSRYEKICLLCNKPFTTNVKHTLICNREHYGHCVVCGKKFRIADKHRPAKTCSNSCASVLTHTEQAEETRKKNSLKKYGTEFPTQNEKIKKKIKETLDNSENDTRIGSKRWNEMMKSKYGVENISQNEMIKDKKKLTYIKNYGVENPAAMQMHNYKDWNNFKNFVKNLNADCLELAEYFQTSVSKIRQQAYKTNTVKYIKDFHTYSHPELIIKRMLLSLGLKENEDFIPHTRRIIKPLELDFYLPKYKLAIEVSPTYTHNSMHIWDSQEGLDENYHYNKFRQCKKAGIDLITVFDWTNEDLVENILKSKNNKDINKYDYETVKYEDVKNILSNNFNNDRYIIKLAKHKQNIIGVFVWYKNNYNKTIELKYYSNFNNDKFQVFQQAIENIASTVKTYNKIIIVSDSSIGLNNILLETGFTIKEQIEPKVHYCSKNVYVKSHKTINKNKNILIQGGFLPVYDCGYIKWQLTL